MKQLLVIILSVFVICVPKGQADEPDFTLLGGDLTSSFTDRNAIQLTAPNVDDETLRLKQLAGFSVFHGVKTASQGLGPFFNHQSCSSCHVNNGRGKVRISSNSFGSSMVIKVGLKGLNPDGSPLNVPKVGEQLRDRKISGKTKHDIDLEWRSVSGAYPDGTKYQLRKPRLKFRIGKKGKRAFAHSLRMTPPVIGPGLIEAIPESEILAKVDPNDSDGDGISGRAQYVPNVRTATKSLGRFGHRASHPTLEQQSAAAAFNDMGLTNAIYNDNPLVYELPEADLEILSVYQQLAGVPAAQNQNDPDVVLGKNLFQTIGCDKCHTPTYVTAGHKFEELNDQLIHPFTDLLLHDLGPGLADTRPEFEASGSEWRTAPLWGLGFSENLSKIDARYLHDGRARTVEEAILWHGGEAEAARNNFKNLSKQQREALLKFLKSL